MHTYIHTYIHSYIVTYIHTCTNTYMHISMFAEPGASENNSNSNNNSTNISFEIDELNRSINDEQKFPTFYDTINVLLETMTFFNNNCLQKSRNNTDRISSMRASKDYKVEGAYIAAKEWENLRTIRHNMMINSLIKSIKSFKQENSRLALHWYNVEDEIHGIDDDNDYNNNDTSFYQSREGSTSSMPSHAPPPGKRLNICYVCINIYSTNNDNYSYFIALSTYIYIYIYI